MAKNIHLEVDFDKLNKPVIKKDNKYTYFMYKASKGHFEKKVINKSK